MQGTIAKFHQRLLNTCNYTSLNKTSSLIFCSCLNQEKTPAFIIFASLLLPVLDDRNLLCFAGVRWLEMANFYVAKATPTAFDAAGSVAA